MKAIKFNTAFAGIMSTHSLLRLENNPFRAGRGKKKSVDYNLEKKFYKSQPFIIILK